MTAPLTFGDTFTLPSTGDAPWTIRDVRPRSYRPAADDIYTRHTLVAQAICARYAPGNDPRKNIYAQYDAETGWVIYDNTMDHELRTAVLADLNARGADMTYRTDEEWRVIHFEDLRHELEQGLSTVGAINIHGPVLAPHPLVTDEENVAFITAIAAVTAAKGRDEGLFDHIYATTLARLSA